MGKLCFIQQQSLGEDEFSDIQSICAVRYLAGITGYAGLTVCVGEITFAGRMDGGQALLFHIIPLLLFFWVSSRQLWVLTRETRRMNGLGEIKRLIFFNILMEDTLQSYRAYKTSYTGVEIYMHFFTSLHVRTALCDIQYRVFDCFC